MSIYYKNKERNSTCFSTWCVLKQHFFFSKYDSSFDQMFCKQLYLDHTNITPVIMISKFSYHFPCLAKFEMTTNQKDPSIFLINRFVRRSKIQFLGGAQFCGSIIALQCKFDDRPESWVRNLLNGCRENMKKHIRVNKYGQQQV